MGISPKKLLTGSLHYALKCVQPDALFRKYLRLHNDTLYFRNIALYNKNDGRLFLAASGKASCGMAKALLPYLPVEPEDSLLIAPEICNNSTLHSCRGNHPLPGAESLEAGRKMLTFLKTRNENDTLIFLLSGGSSAMMEYPRPGIGLQDLQKANTLFLSRGLDIGEINLLRGRLSALKAGKATAACAARTRVLLISDVIGNDISVIGSGPFAVPKPGMKNPGKIIDKYRLDKDLPKHILDRMLLEDSENSAIREVPHYLAGSNMDLLEAAEAYFTGRNIPVETYPESIYGEARNMGDMIAGMVNNYSGPRPGIILFGGESTVRLNKDPGYGGRSQEMALAILAGLKDTNDYTILCAGSDGIDGNTDADGALVDGQTYLRAQKLGLSPDVYLQNHDSYHFHRPCGSLIKTGPTGTNVADICIVFLR